MVVFWFAYSEDEDWDPERVSGSEKDKVVTKKKLHFGHFEQLPRLFAAFDGREEAVEQALLRFKSSAPASAPYPNMAELVQAVSNSLFPSHV